MERERAELAFNVFRGIGAEIVRRWNKGRAGFLAQHQKFLFIMEKIRGMQRTAHIVKLHTQPIVRHYLT